MSNGGMIIIGAGECGARAAFSLRENGYDGPVTLIGDEIHLPYERPPLSKATMIEALPHKPIAPAERYSELAITVRLGVTVDSLLPELGAITLHTGETLAFDKLLLATGSRPRRLPETGTLCGRIKYLRTFDDASDIRSRLGPERKIAIIGAGFIGLELAASARSLGCEVTVIEAQRRVLMRGVPEEIAQVIAARHIAEGVNVKCGVGIASISETADGVTITLLDGTSLDFDIAVVGIGAIPNTSLAEAAGLQTDNGIAVDNRLRTSIPNIFAAGDCCSFPLARYGGRRVRLEAWRNAQDQGNLAAKNMLGAEESISSIPYFWTDQYDLTLQVAGLAEGAASVVRRDIDADSFILFHLDAAGTVLAASGLGRGNAVGRDIRLSERFISSCAVLNADALASPAVRLKSLLAA